MRDDTDVAGVGRRRRSRRIAGGTATGFGRYDGVHPGRGARPPGIRAGVR